MPTPDALEMRKVRQVAEEIVVKKCDCKEAKPLAACRACIEKRLVSVWKSGWVSAMEEVGFTNKNWDAR
jgi:hypothetical protein